MITIDGQLFYTTREVALMCDVQPFVIHNWCCRGKIPAEMFLRRGRGKGNLFIKTNTINFVNKKKASTPSKLVRFGNLELEPEVMKRFLAIRQKRIINSRKLNI
jgi:hypothetical protein